MHSNTVQHRPPPMWPTLSFPLQGHKPELENILPFNIQGMQSIVHNKDTEYTLHFLPLSKLPQLLNPSMLTPTTCRPMSCNLCSARSSDGRKSPIVLELRGVPCAIICPRILTLDLCRQPIGDFKNLGRHSRCGAERCNSIWRPRWLPHRYTQYNSICICLGVMNLVSLFRFWVLGNPLKSFSGWKK